VADAHALQAGDVLGHLAVILDECERAATTETIPVALVLTPARERAARELLGRRDLLDRAAAALEALGLVGEDRNKRLAYLVATSRLLDRPLSAILRAASGSGKSTLLERVADLVPEESTMLLSRITAASLYYLGADALRHKLILVDEAIGAAEADHAVRVLQSSGKLTLSTTVKGKAENFTVYGPVSVMSGTTSATINPENLSRCLELALDDSPEQTKRIQEASARAWSGEARPRVDVERWKDAQRRLEPLDVSIPYAPRLAFPARTTRDRRDHAKLLGLVASVALLHQYQRERDADGRLIATVADYQVVYDLVRPMLEAQVPDLSPRAAVLYRALGERELASFTRRDAAAILSSSYSTTIRTIDELLGQELIVATGNEKPKRFRLLDRSLLGGSASLTPPEKLDAPR
jgi:energy-coupling factor transporter ATP-binding protein EcfA2